MINVAEPAEAVVTQVCDHDPHDLSERINQHEQRQATAELGAAG